MKKERFEVNGDTMVIHLAEDLDHHNAVYIREMSDGYVDKYPIKRIIFDFCGVEFMDSSGIGVIMGRYKQMSYVGGSVWVTNVGKNADRIFRMTGLYKLVQQMDYTEVR